MITYEEAVEWFRYDPETGELWWKKAPKHNPQVLLKPVGCTTNSSSRKQVTFNRKSYIVSRLIWLLMYNKFPDNHIDHIDGNPHNNKLENLRDVTRSINLQNQKLHYNNISGVPGVKWVTRLNKWETQISSNGTRYYLGIYRNLFDAVCARKAAEVLYGFHPNHGRS